MRKIPIHKVFSKPTDFYSKHLGLKYSVVIRTLHSERIHMVSTTTSLRQYLSLVYLCFIFRMQPFCGFFPLVFSQYPISTDLQFGFEDSKQKISNESLNDKSGVKPESWTSCPLTETLVNFCLKVFFLICILYPSLQLGHCNLVKTKDSQGLLNLCGKLFNIL